jgi:hypothetical protein
LWGQSSRRRTGDPWDVARCWNNHKDVLKEEVDAALMGEYNTTDWAVASAEQKENRQKEWTAAKQKCVKEQADLMRWRMAAKATRAVVEFVGIVEIPVSNDENRQQAVSRRTRGGTATPASPSYASFGGIISWNQTPPPPPSPVAARPPRQPASPHPR